MRRFGFIGLLLFAGIALTYALAADDPQEYTQNGAFWADLKSIVYEVSGSNLTLKVCYHADFPDGGPHVLNGVFYWDVDRDPTTGSIPSTVTFDRPGFGATTVPEPDEWSGNGRSEGSEYRLVWSLPTRTAGSSTLSGNNGLYRWNGAAWQPLSTTVTYAFVDGDSSGRADCLHFTFPESAIGSPASPDGLLWSVPQMGDIQWGWMGSLTLKGAGSGDAITVDGEGGDWDSVAPIANYSDPSDDAWAPEEVDLVEMKFTNDDNFFYASMKVHGPGTTDTNAPGRQGYNQEQKWYRSQWIHLDVDGDGTYERKAYASWELNGNGQMIFAVKVLDQSWSLVEQYSFYGAYSDTSYDAEVAPSDPGDGGGAPCPAGSFCGAARLDTDTTTADEGVLEFRIPLSALGLNPGDTIQNFAVGDTFGEYQDYLPAAPGKATYLTPSPHKGKVVINEVLYRQTCHSTDKQHDEFVELYVAQDVDMCGWTLSDGNVVGGDTEGPGTFTYTFNTTDGCTFHAGDYIVIWIGDNTQPTPGLKDAPRAALQVYLGKRPKLNNSGDDVWLFDASGEIVDYMAYGTDNAINDQSVLPPGFWDGNNPPASCAAGQSLSLTPNGQDTDSGTAWECTTSDTASGPTTLDTDDLTCSSNNRVTSAGVNNNGDYGDAPASYGQAYHSPFERLYLGTTPPDEDDCASWTTLNGTNDDATGGDDEDGITTWPSLAACPGATYSVEVTTHNTLGQDATLVAWIDFDGNGTFDADEAIPPITVPDDSGSGRTYTLTWTLPADVQPGNTYVRVRLGSQALTASDAAGYGGLGEVEDYPITIAACPTPTPTNTPTPTATFTPTPTATFTPTPTATFTPTPTAPLPPFDPPTGTKVGYSDNWPIIEWRQVWINPNTVAMAVRIVDPIPPGTTYIPGSLHCEPRGSSTQTTCAYQAGSNQILWEGTLGPDAGHTTEEDANNEVVITFRVRVTDPDLVDVRNEASAYWDENRNGQVDPTDPNVQAQAPIQRAAVVHRPALPETGFGPVPRLPGRIPKLSLEVVRRSPLWIEIPRLGVAEPVIGVPQGENLDWMWHVAWLWGTAFPGWVGNSVLTAHVDLPTGQPGPFARLHELQWGDRIRVHVYGTVYEYAVREMRIVPANATWPLQPPNDGYAWVTLVTCAHWDAARQRYRDRLIVRAVLVRWYSE